MPVVVIEQDEMELKHSVELHLNAALETLRLVSAEIKSDVEPEALEGELRTSYSFRPASSKRIDNALLLDLFFELNILQTQDDSAPHTIASLACTFRARYSLRPRFQPTPEQIKAFHAGNAIFNCWPFFREFVQSSSVRLALPPPPVPFLRFGPKPPPVAKEASPTGSPSKAKRRPSKRTPVEHA